MNSIVVSNYLIHLRLKYNKNRSQLSKVVEYGIMLCISLYNIIQDNWPVAYKSDSGPPEASGDKEARLMLPFIAN